MEAFLYTDLRRVNEPAADGTTNVTVREKMMEIGLAGWAFHRSILQDKSLALLDLPAVARKGLAYLREHFGGLA